jgi:arginine/ornithine N-succinyltransferase beta subunit
MGTLFALAGQTGYGMTTLPADRMVPQRRIEESKWAFILFKVESPHHKKGPRDKASSVNGDVDSYARSV